MWHEHKFTICDKCENLYAECCHVICPYCAVVKTAIKAVSMPKGTKENNWRNRKKKKILI